jgi:predicted dehydrogenase
VRKIRIGTIGCGYWGPNLLRNFASLPDTDLGVVCDLREERLSYVRQNYPNTETCKDYRNLLEDKDLDAVVVATPATNHYSLVRASLLSGKHVLVEKPLSLRSEECKDLIKIAKEMKKVLMVSHTFLYNAAVHRLKQYVKEGELGQIYYIYSSRLNLGNIRQDINAMWNFAPHDVSIILYLLEQEPVRVAARGLSYIQKGIEDIVFIDMDFAGGISAHIHISWLDPHKVRKMTVVGSKKMIVYDDTSNDARLQLYDKGVSRLEDSGSLGSFDDFGKFQLLLRAGDVYIPKINFVEPLREECAHFLECIRGGKRPITDGENGLKVVNVLEAADKSLKNGGCAVAVERTL